MKKEFRVIAGFILALLVPIFAADYLLYVNLKDGKTVEVPKQVVVAVSPTASPSATIAPTVSKKFTPVKTTVTVKPTVTE